MDTQDSAEERLYHENLAILAEIAGRTYDAGEQIFRAGEPGLELYFIVRGEVQVYLGSEADLRELMRLGAGEVFGEMALINHVPRTASVKALAETRALALDSKLFYQLVGEYPILAKKVIELMGRRMITMAMQFKAMLPHKSLG